MAEFDSENGTPIPEHPTKRRKVHDGSPVSTPPYSSPDSPNGRSNGKPLPARSLSIRRGRPPSRSRSRSRSRSVDDEVADKKRYYSSSPSSRSRSRLSRSRSRSRSLSRSPIDSRSSSRTRSRSSRRRSLSRSRSRATTSRSPARLLSGSPLQPPPEPAPLRPNYHHVFEMRGHSKAISQVRISPDGRWIASASADGTARIWDASTGAHLDTLVGHMAGVSCLAWSPDSFTLATGSDDKAIRLWDRVTAEPAHAVSPNNVEMVRRDGRGGTDKARGSRRPLLGHHNYVYCLAFSPKGNILASGSYDEAVFLWDVRAGRLMRSLPAHSDPVSGIDFSRDGTLVVSCSTDGLIRIWDTSTGQCLRTLLLLNEDNPAVTNVCFSPNGRYVLASNLDSCIRLWDYIPHPSTVRKTYQGHRNNSFSIGASFGVLADGRVFVTAASEDGDVVLWDVKSKDVVQRLSAHDGTCFWVDVCGGTMVSCGEDGKIVVFRNKGSEEENGLGDDDDGVDGDETVMNGIAPYPLEEEGGQMDVENGLPPVENVE